MILRAASPLLSLPLVSSRHRSINGVALLVLGLACSAPPGADDEGQEVPEFGGTVAPGVTPGVGAPGAAMTGAGNQAAAGAQPSAMGAGGSSGNEQAGGNVPLQPAQGQPAQGQPAQGQPAQGQNTGAGQSAGAGGSAMVSPPPATNPGTAGSSMTPPGAGGGSMGPAEPTPGVTPPPQPGNPLPGNPPPANPAPNGSCAGQFLCDDFEDVADGASPSAPLWTIIEGFAVRPESARVQVSTDNARTGTRALRVDADSGRTGVQARLPQNRYFVRAWLQIDSAPRGPVFIAGGTDQNSEVRLRIQGESFATINVIPGDAVRPAAANGGGCPDCVVLTPNEWFCAEMFVDDAARNATLWIDDVEAASIVNGDGGWPAQPANPALFLGSWGLQGGLTGVWIDDVVAGPARIGCD